MVQSKAVEVEEIKRVSHWELTEEEMRSILLPPTEKSRQNLIEAMKNMPDRLTCARILIDTKTGEIEYG